jgi:serine/threonine protein kinase
MKMQSLVAQHESERNKLLRDQLVTYKQKTDAEKIHNLHLEVLLDKCRNNKCIAKTKMMSHTNKCGNFSGQQSVNEKKIRNNVSLDEIEFIVKGSQRIVLGEGCFGKCFLAKLKRNGALVTVKIGQKSGGRYSDSLKKEAEILSQLCHPNIPFFFGITEGKSPALIIEFHGDIAKLNSLTVSSQARCKHLSISSSEWFEIMNCICNALAYIHQIGILHNDIKANNVLLSLKADKWSPMIIDFGKATYINGRDKYPQFNEAQIQKYKDNYPHIAPELYIQNVEKSVCSDVYSYGWMLKGLQDCFPGRNIKHIFEKCLHSCPSQRPLCMLAVKEMLNNV